MMSKTGSTLVAVASSGGHYVQLKRIVSNIKRLEAYNVLYVRTKIGGDDVPIGNEVLVTDFSRTNWWKMFVAFFEFIKVLGKPDVKWVVTTGAAPGLLALIIARCCFKKTIWIDSIANTSKISASGGVAKYFSNVTLTQWEHLEGCGRVEFMGRVI